MFRFIGDLNKIDDGEKFESNYRNIYLEDLQLGKDYTDKQVDSFSDLDIKTRDEKFQIDLIDKLNFFLLSECEKKVK